MKIEMAGAAETKFECPFCYGFFPCESAMTEDGASLICPFCGKKSGLPQQKTAGTGRQTDINVRHPYVAGKWHARKRIVSSCFKIVKWSALILLFYMLGGGIFNDTYFLGVKRTPGFEKTFIHLAPVSAFGMARMEQNLRSSYSYYIIKYNKKSGLVFFERL